MLQYALAPRTVTRCLLGAAVAAVALVCGIALLRPRPATSPQAAIAAPDFTLPAASGAPHRIALHALRGHPVLLTFFNTQCSPCLQELPALRQAARAYRARGVIVLGVDTGGDSADTARRFVRAAAPPFAVVVDTQQAVAWRYDVGAWPTSVFLDAQGRARGQVIGPLDAATLRDGLAQAGAIPCGTCTPLPPPGLAAGVPSGAARATLTGDVLYRPPRPSPAFALRDQRGRVVTPKSLRGRVVALTFLSATCLEQCPLVGQTLSRVDHLLGPDARRLAIVAISVDPEQDAPEAIRRFAASAGWPGTDWHYLSASRAVLSRVWGAFGVFVEAPPPIFKAGQSLVHGAGLFLLDPQGRLRAYDDAPFLAPQVAASVRALL